jgi:cobalamin biosynthetic protein CobC
MSSILRETATLAPIAHGGGLSEACRRFGGMPSDWLDLSTGINPLPPALPSIDPNAWHRLPDHDALHAAERAAQRFYGAPAGIRPVALPGTQSAIQILPRLAAVGTVAILSPTYGEYARSFAAQGWTVRDVPSIKDIGPDVAAVVVVNPNNPTGRTIAPGDLRSCAESLVARGGMLVVDEAFADLDPTISCVPMLGAVPGLIVLKSFGKFFGLAGVRLGFALTDRATEAAVRAHLGPWAVSGPALAIAADVLGRRDLHHRLRAMIEERNQATSAVLRGAGLPVIGDGGLFLLVEHQAASALHQHLAASHILVRMFDYAPTWLRFGLTSDDGAAARLATALQSFHPMAERRHHAT